MSAPAQRDRGYTLRTPDTPRVDQNGAALQRAFGAP